MNSEKLSQAIDVASDINTRYLQSSNNPVLQEFSSVLSTGLTLSVGIQKLPIVEKALKRTQKLYKGLAKAKETSDAPSAQDTLAEQGGSETDFSDAIGGMRIRFTSAFESSQDRIMDLDPEGDITDIGNNITKSAVPQQATTNALDDTPALAEEAGSSDLLADATAVSTVDDWNPIGLATTIGLGIATLATDIAEAFEGSKQNVPTVPGAQFGVY